MNSAMRLRRLAFGLALFPFPLSALALPVDKCFPTADALRKLEAEGQRVVTKSKDGKSVVTRSAEGKGYVLAANGNALCVSASLDNVSTADARGQDASVRQVGEQGATTVVCSSTKRLPSAADFCARMAEMPPVVQTISANASKSILSSQTAGTVRITFSVCRDSSGREDICGRMETARN